MALTAEQETEILTRVGNGELPMDVMKDMGVDKADFRAFRRDNKEAFRVSRVTGSREQRLTRLRERRTNLEARLEQVNQRIAALESEE